MFYKPVSSRHPPIFGWRSDYKLKPRSVLRCVQNETFHNKATTDIKAAILHISIGNRKTLGLVLTAIYQSNEEMDMHTPPARFADFFSTAKLDNTFNNSAGATSCQEAHLDTQLLLAQLDNIFGIPKKLSPKEQAQADAIEQQISRIYQEFDQKFNDDYSDKDTDSKTKQAAQLYKELDKLYGVKVYEELSDQEQRLVDYIEEKLWPTPDPSMQ